MVVASSIYYPVWEIAITLAYLYLQSEIINIFWTVTERTGKNYYCPMAEISLSTDVIPKLVVY